MAINFPNSPSPNQLYTYDNKTWEWNGVYWEVYSGLTGYVVTANTVGDGVSIISGVSGNSLYLKSISGVNINVIDSNEKITLSGFTVTLTGGTNIQITGTYPNFGVNYTGETPSGNYVHITGDTMTGDLIVPKITANTLNVNQTINFPTTTGSTYGVITQNNNRLLHTYGVRNIFLGSTSGNFTASTGVTGITDNIGIGVNTLNGLTTGKRNIGMGLSSLISNTTGSDNIGIGNGTLQSNITGNYNVGVGINSLQATTASRNTGIGYQSLYSNVTGASNVAIGYNAGYNETGSNKLHIANTDTKTLIYGEFDNNRVGINTTSLSNAFTVSGSTDPVKLIGLQPASDNSLLTIDNTGVVHTYSLTALTASTLTALTATTSNLYLSLGGGTVTGGTNFTNGLTANTISASTYSNLPNTLYTGNGTLSSNRTVNQTGFSLTFTGTTASTLSIIERFNQGSTINNPSGLLSHTQGLNTTASGNYSHAEGNNSFAQGLYSHAEGVSTANGPYSHSEGNGTAQGTGSHAEGLGTSSNGEYSHAEGRETNSIGNYSHAEGHKSRSYGTSSHAEGFYTDSNGNYSHSEGNNTDSNGEYSHSEGYYTKSVGLYSHSEGAGYIIDELNTFEPLANSLTQFLVEVSGNTYESFSSSWVDETTIAIDGDWSAIPNNSIVSKLSFNYFNVNLCYYGPYTIVKSNYFNDISQTYVIFENGWSGIIFNSITGCSNISNGIASHSEGFSTRANGNYSHSEGIGTYADGEGQHVSGKYNVTGNTTSLFVIGNGTGDNNRSDILKVNQSEIIINGDLSVLYGITGNSITGNTILSTGEIQSNGDLRVGTNGSGALIWVNDGSTYSGKISAGNITSSDKISYLPNNTGTLVLSINGNTADDTGEITLPFANTITDHYIPVQSGATFANSFLYQSGNTLQTIYNTENLGLNLDYNNQIYKLGSDTLGTLGTGIHLAVDEPNNEIRTELGVSNKLGFYTKSSTQVTTIGDYGTISPNPTKLSITGTTKEINLMSYDHMGLKVFPITSTQKKMSIGGVFSFGNNTNITIDDYNQSISLTNITASTDTDLVTIGGDTVLRKRSISTLPFLPTSGGTVTGATNFTNGLTANTISASTYSNLPNTLYTGNGSLSSTRTVNLNGNNLSFSSTTEGTVLTIRNGGSVGIGTNSPANLLHVSGSSTPVRIEGLGSLQESRHIVSDSNGILYYRTDVVNSVTASTGLSGSSTSGNITLINTLPDQTVTISGGTGIQTGGTYPNFTLINTSPDQTVTISGGTNIQVSGTYPNFTLTYTGQTSFPYLPLSGGTVTGATSFTGGLTANTISAATYNNLPVSSVTSGTGISATTSNGVVTVINTSPDQTVTISGGTGIQTGGTYPNFTLINTSPDKTVVLNNGTGINATGTYPNFTITNTAPDQTVTISGGTNIQITGTYPNFGVNFTGTTGGGTFTGGTVTGGTYFTGGLSANTLVVSATTGADPVRFVTLQNSTTDTNIVTADGTGVLHTRTLNGAGIVTWSKIGTNITGSTNNGYITTAATQTVITLPATADVGTIIEVVGIGGDGANGWRISQLSNHQIHFGILNTTSGATGNLQSTKTYDAVKLLCTTTNNEYTVISAVGNIDVN